MFQKEKLASKFIDMYKLIKSLLDRLIAFLGLIVLFLPLLIIALIIKIDSRGVAVFRQERVGKNGKIFKLFKFRTMKSTTVKADASNPVIKDDNQNLTRVGRVLRKIKADELLQLLNVLVGDMSIVGPRPLMPIHTQNYEEWERQKFAVKPGMSGLSQVRGNVYLSSQERSYYDVKYAQKPTFLKDCEIFFKTIGVIFCGEEKFLRPVPAEEIQKMKDEFAARKSSSK